MSELHADAFGPRVDGKAEWDWVELHSHSLGWFPARTESRLVGFVNVISAGLVDAWIQDEVVAPEAPHQGIGLALVQAARDAAKEV